MPSYTYTTATPVAERIAREWGLIPDWGLASELAGRIVVSELAGRIVAAQSLDAANARARELFLGLQACKSAVLTERC